MVNLLDTINHLEAKAKECCTLIVLDNGLKVIIQNVEGYPSFFQGDLKVPFGSKFEAPEHAGIAHFNEHMCYSGTEKYPTSEEIDRACRKIGYRPNAGTSTELISIPFRSLNGDLRLTLDIVTQLGFAPIFPENKLEKEKKVVINEIGRYYSNPMTEIHDWRLGCSLVGFHNVHNTLGTPDSVQAIDRDILLYYRDRFMNVSHSYLTVIGDFDPDSLHHVFDVGSKFPINTYDIPVIINKPQEQERKIIEKEFMGIRRAYISYSFNIPGFNHNERAALAIADEILNGLSNSRLFSSLREREGLTYGVESIPLDGELGGKYFINFDVSPHHVERAIKVVDEELFRLASDVITNDEMEEARKRLEIISLSNLYSLEKPAEIMYNINKNNFNEFNNVRRLIGVEKEDIRNAARTYLTPDRAMINIGLPL